MSRVRVLLAVMFVGLSLAPASAQLKQSDPPARTQDRDHFQLKLGAAYDQGDFGTSETSHTIFLPLTFRYLGDRFDIGVTGSWVYLDAPRDVVVVEGTPQRTERGDRGRQETSGIGDLLFRGRYFLIDDPGEDSFLPSIAPFVKLKVPTADEDKNLGTGEFDGGFGVEFDKAFGALVLFGDVGYTFMGDPPGQDFRDRPSASIGAAYRIVPDVTVAALLDWRRALVKGNPDPLELLGVVTIRLAPALSLSPNVFVGLTEGSPDFGMGVELSYRFGRW